MRDLNYQLKNMCSRNKDGSFSTQSNRQKILFLMANQLYEMGYRHLKANALKEKHVMGLVEKWTEDGITSGGMKNRMATLRWWAEKTNNESVVAKNNDFYGIGNRQFVTNENKAVSVNQEQLDKVKDGYVKASLLLQSAFGLRREEAIKIFPAIADKGDHLALKGSWTKGGKERSIPIITEYQREVLDQVKRLVGDGALIPLNKNYIQQLRIYERHTTLAGLNKLHGLRHQYAQQRYEALTGWKSPAVGGLVKKKMTQEQKEKDLESRLLISKELGHEREQITAVYLGR
ncbi:MAG: phage integrase N-terminal domain-containing protein [Cocleimonas sp.]